MYREIHKAIFDLNVDHVGRSSDRCHRWSMRKHLILLPLLVATAPTEAAVDPKIAEFCIKATDIAGCVQNMTGGLPSKQAKDVEDGLRTWTHDDGTIVRCGLCSDGNSEQRQILQINRISVWT